MIIRLTCSILLVFAASGAQTRHTAGTMHDSAVSRAREFLEDPVVRWLVVQALHQGAEITGQVFDAPIVEAAAGANIRYSYNWKLGSASTDNTVTFHCDSMGRIDRIVSVEPDSDRAKFIAFTQSVAKAKDQAIKELFKSLFDQERRENDKTPEWLYGLERDALTWMVQNSIPANGRAVLEWMLGMGYDLSHGGWQRPAYGIDDFRFGLGKTQAEREFTGTAEAFQKALPDLIDEAAKSGGMKDDYGPQTAVIAHVAQTCSGITADQAFRTSSDGGYGQEHPERLGPPFAICMTPPIGSTAASTISGNGPARRITYRVAPPGRGWKEALGVTIEIQFTPRQSDPETTHDEMFERYGIVRAQIAQQDVSCERVPGGGTPADQTWRQDGTNVFFRVRFECEHAEIYNGGSHLMVAHLTLAAGPGKRKKDQYEGAGPFSPCPGGTGKIELTRWLKDRIEGKVQFPNKYTHQCGGLKDGYVMNGLFHTDFGSLILVPTQ